GARPSRQCARADTTPAAATVRKLAVSDVRIIDPDSRLRDELGDAEKVIDGDENKGWETDTYTAAKFGNNKKGMGVWIDLGAPHTVKSLQAVLSATNASAELYAGTSDFASSSSGDKQLLASYRNNRIGQPFEDHDGSKMTFNGFNADQKYRYLLLWITELPPNDRGYQIGVQEITVQGS
ncbi:serine/threonine protein kinase, partial [Micromonospora sp. ATA32]|nr:serine/threonine protein kinase [Micromonospora sp. ATA32]